MITPPRLLVMSSTDESSNTQMAVYDSTPKYFYDATIVSDLTIDHKCTKDSLKPMNILEPC